MTAILLVGSTLSDCNAIEAAVPSARVVAVPDEDAARLAVASGHFHAGIAAASIFRDAAIVTALGRIPWIVLTRSPDEELTLATRWPDIDARCLRLDDSRRYLELLPYRIREAMRERVFSTIGDNFPGMIAYWDNRERCQFATAAYLRWFGISRDQLLGKTLRELLGEIYPLNEPYIRGALRGEHQRFERTIPDPAGGAARHGLAIYTPDVRGGEVQGFVAVVTDITEQRDAVQALRERERGWATLFEILPVGVSVVDADGRVLEMNAALAAILGIDQRDLANGAHKRRRYINADGSPFDAKTFPSTRSLAEGRAIGPAEIGVVREDGTTVWTSVTAAPLPSPGQVVVVTRDLTSEKHIAARFQAMIEASTVPYALNNDAGVITYLNAAFVRTFGYTREDIPTLDQWWPLAYPDETYRRWVSTEWKARLDRAVANGTDFEPLELRIRAKDGTMRTALVRAVALGGSLTGEHLVVLVDVTEQRLAEMERLRYEKQQLDGQKMEAIGALAGGVAHDFNNLLLPILGYAELTLAALPPRSEVRENLIEIRTAAERAASLVRQILAVSRPGGEEKSAVNLGALVEEAAQLLRASLPASIHLQTVIEPECPAVLANPTRLHQVILNLVANARDAMSVSGGRLELCVSRAGSDTVKLTVRDTGEGIPPELQRRVFEPYFTTKVGGKGTGLGLATVHAIVKELAGAIALTSSPGEGTLVEVRLSAFEGEQPILEIPAPAALGQGEHIIVVDDEPAVGLVTCRHLQDLGYRVTVFTSPLEALALMRADASVAALLTDYSMPNINGVQLAALAKAVRPLPIVLMSGFADPSHARGADAAIFSVLLKPFTRAALAEVVHSALKK